MVKSGERYLPTINLISYSIALVCLLLLWDQPLTAMQIEGISPYLQNQIRETQQIKQAKGKPDGNALQLDFESDSMFGAQQVIHRSPLPDPSAVEVVDLDGDGDDDIVASTQTHNANKIVWYANTDQGFTAQRILENVNEGVNSMKVENVIGDKNPEIIFVNRNGVYLYENNDGVIGGKRVIFESEDPLYLARVLIADVNNDGQNDIIAGGGSFGEQNMLWFKNQGKVFDAKRVIFQRSDNGILLEMATIDVNSDGYTDLLGNIWFESGHKLHLFRNQNTSFDSTGTVIDTSGVLTGIETVDMELDGDPDLITAGVPSIKLFRNEEDSLQPPKIIGADSDTLVSIEAVNIKGDQAQELVAEIYHGKMHWYEQTDSSFRKSGVVTDTIDQIYDIESSDLNRNENKDIVGNSTKEDNLVVSYNQDNGFGSTMLLEDQSMAKPIDVLSADINQDGKSDLVVASADDDKISWFAHNQQEFSDPQTVTRADDNVQSLAKEDINQDGNVDIVSVSSKHSKSDGRNKVVWHENTNSGFNEHVIDDSTKRPRSVYTADLTGDTKPDILVLSLTGVFETKKLTLYENTGTGFNAQILVDDEDNIYTVTVADLADLDEDQDIDIVAHSKWRERKIFWFENTTSGISGPHIIKKADYIIYDLKVADIDEDSDSDIIISRETGYEQPGLGYYENTKDGFSLFQKIWKFGVQELLIEDFNKDGADDIVAKQHEEAILRFEYTNTGFSSPRKVSESAKGKVELVTSDIDVDGDQDLVSVSSEDSKLAWYKNNQTNTSSPETGKEIPKQVRLHPNAPNPFNPTTKITFSLPRAFDLKLTVYDVLGRRVAILVNGKRQAGKHSVTFDASNLSSGVYIYRLKADGFSESRKMLLVN